VCGNVTATSEATCPPLTKRSGNNPFSVRGEMDCFARNSRPYITANKT
jgi:hypothetical protein